MADDAQKQQAYTAILEHFIETGRAPHFTELAGTLSLTPGETRELLPEAAAAGVGCWISHDTDYIASWAPFSNIPTQYIVSVDGEQKWYGQCGVESLAVRWLFPGREVRLDVRCLDCGEPMMARFRDDEILELDPPGIAGHVNIPLPRWGEVSLAFN